MSVLPETSASIDNKTQSEWADSIKSDYWDKVGLRHQKEGLVVGVLGHFMRMMGLKLSRPLYGPEGKMLEDRLEEKGSDWSLTVDTDMEHVVTAQSRNNELVAHIILWVLILFVGGTFLINAFHTASTREMTQSVGLKDQPIFGANPAATSTVPLTNSRVKLVTDR
jgi:hypothetical protein